jgi:prepilin-type N-terminal cleavage/methylation domain-containing protein
MFIIFRKAFTLVEIMIVLVILAIMLAIAVPNYLNSGKTSQKTVCIANLERIDSAVDQWAIDNHMAAGAVLSESQEEDMYSNYVKGGKPKCPSGGTYTIHGVGTKPQVTCSHEDEGHKLP